jgi:hypothetical protein
MTRVHGPALDAWLAAAGHVAPVTITGPLGADDGPDKEVLSGWTCDRIADAEENRRWRGLP